MNVQPHPDHFQSDFEELREAAFRLSAQAEDIVHSEARSAKANLMMLVEVLRAVAVRRTIDHDYGSFMRRHAKDDFQLRMMRAIVFEESVHEWPPMIESTLEAWGYGDSVGPSQIRESKWAKKLKTNRRELLDPRTHFRSMRALLDTVERKAQENGMARTPENIGTLWNNIRARGVSDYGRRVKQFDQMLESNRLDLPMWPPPTQHKKLRDVDLFETQAQAVDKKKRQLQRSARADYGAPQRTILSAGGDHRDNEKSVYNKDRWSSPLMPGFRMRESEQARINKEREAREKRDNEARERERKAQEEIDRQKKASEESSTSRRSGSSFPGYENVEAQSGGKANISRTNGNPPGMGRMP